MNVSDHTTRVFDSDLIKVTQMVARMGGLAQKQITDAIDALARRDTASRARSSQPTKQSMSCSGKSKKRPSPQSRCASLWRSICGRWWRCCASPTIWNESETLPRTSQTNPRGQRRALAAHSDARFKHMAALVASQLAAVLDSFVDRNPANALKVWQGDKEVDALYVSLFRELLTYTMEDPGTISMCIHHLFCAKNIERIGDHATNIAEAVHYMVEGHAIAGERPKGDTSSYVSEKRGTTAKVLA